MATAPGRTGGTRRERRAGLDLGDRRRGTCVRAKKGGSPTGPNPVDRGKKGSKILVLSDAQSVPLAHAVSTPPCLRESQALFKPLILAMPAIRSRRGPRRRHPVKARADKAHVSADPLAWPRGRDLVPRIARPVTSERAATSSLSSAWPRPPPATRNSRNSPRETTSYCQNVPCRGVTECDLSAKRRSRCSPHT